MKIFLLVLISIFSLNATSQILYGSSTALGAPNNMDLEIYVDVPADEVTIIISGPNNKYFAFGMNSTFMSGTYTLHDNGTGSFVERTLGNHNGGSILTSSITSMNTSVSGTTRSDTIRRSINGLNGSYYTFPTTSGTTIPYIWARGNGTTFNYHAQRGFGNITLNQLCTIPPTQLADITICQGDSSQIFGNYESLAGVYSQTLTASNGCDSIVNQELFVTLPVTSTLPGLEICTGDSIQVFGTYQAVQGSYFDTVQSVNTGCDSIIQQDLSFYNSQNTTLPALGYCFNDSVEIAGVYYSAPITLMDTLTDGNGCDSIVSQPIFEFPVEDTVFLNTIQICTGDSALIFGIYQDTAGIFYASETNINGCDSIVSIELQVDSYQTIQLPDAFYCTGDSVEVFGVFVNTVGSYYDTVPSGGSVCDVVHVIDVFENSPAFTTLSTLTICANESVLIHGTPQNTSGIYTDVLQTIEGCDSIVTQELVVNEWFDTTLTTMTICVGESAMIHGNIETQAGIYIDSLQSANGCDSVVTQELVVQNVDAVLELSSNNQFLTVTPAVADLIEWIDCATGLVVPNENDPIFDAEYGAFQAVVHINGCTDTTDCVERPVVGIDEEKVIEFKLSPNPTSGIVKISNAEKIDAISVRNSLGQEFDIVLGNDSFSLLNMPVGVYFIQIIAGGESRTLKVIKN